MYEYILLKNPCRLELHPGMYPYCPCLNAVIEVHQTRVCTEIARTSGWNRLIRR